MPADFTIGVEEEYQLVEPDTGALRSGAAAVREADLTEMLVGEVQDTQLEIGTPVCADASEVFDRLRKLRFQASAAAATEDLEILSAGIHPFSSWEHQRMSSGERPKMLVSRFGQLIRQQQICGLHIHVAVPDRHDRARLMTVLREYIPHVVGLACSSPLYLGSDTGFASYRALAWRSYPFTGVPPRFESSAQYGRFIDMLIRTGAIPDARTVYWSIRPSARYPTLEFRMCDACPRLADAVAIAAFARAVVVAAAEGLLRESASAISPGLQDQILTENEWFAARDGLDAVLIAHGPGSQGIPLRARIASLLDLVRPIAEGLGDGPAMVGIENILAQGNAADRIRSRRAQGTDLVGLLDWLVQETRVGTGIDRRSDHRETVSPEQIG